jgi:zinc protease
MGADSNAFTSDDLTVYHILAGKEALPTIVEIEADRFQNLAYSEPDFRKEARAVLGEYNKGASDPLQNMFETLYDRAFRVHTYKHTTIGFLRDIENMPNEFVYSRDFFDRYYRPDNVTLLVVGDVVPSRVFRLIERRYGRWTKGPARPAVPSEPPQTEPREAALTWNGATLPMLLMGFHAPAFSTRNIDVPALEILAELVFSERAPLIKRLVLEEQKVESLNGGYARHIDANLFTVYARVKNLKDLPYVQRSIEAEIARVARDGVSKKALADVLAHTRYAFAGQLDTADHVALVCAEFIALTGRLSSLSDTFRLLARVTPADVQRVARTYFASKNRTVVTLVGKSSGSHAS